MDVDKEAFQACHESPSVTKTSANICISVVKKIFLYFLLNNRTFIIIAITLLAISTSSLHNRREYTTELGSCKPTATLKIKFKSSEK